MRQALITLVLYVVPLPVVLFFLNFLEGIHARDYNYLVEYSDNTRAFMFMFRWFDGSLRSIASTMLLGVAFWMLHQGFRATACHVLQ